MNTFYAGSFAYTDKGLGLIISFDDGKYQIQLAHSGGKMISVLPEDARSDVQELQLRTRCARYQIAEEMAAATHAKALGTFPDMTDVIIPSDPMAYFRALPKGLRNVLQHGVYSPANLPPKFVAHLDVNRLLVDIRLAWALKFDPFMHELCRELTAKLPPDIRALDCDPDNEKNERAAKGYVWFPIPEDRTIIPEAFSPIFENNRVEIGNIKLALGLMVMGYPCTKYASMIRPRRRPVDPPLFAEAMCAS